MSLQIAARGESLALEIPPNAVETSPVTIGSL
jgi:hypothetical protein